MQFNQKRFGVMAHPAGHLITAGLAQNPAPNPERPKKANTRPSETSQPKPDPFDGASVEKMTGQCVKLETEQGSIVIEMLPAKAPEAVRNFLNLAATGSLDTTTFSRIVPGFVIQGGNLSTSEKWNQQLANRMGKNLPDEPNDVKHERDSKLLPEGVVWAYDGLVVSDEQ